MVEVRTQLENESEKNIELSAELLTLVNQREVLSSQLAEIQISEKSLKKSNEDFLEEAKKLRDENSDLKSNFVTAQDELVRVRQNAMLAEMEVKRAVLEKEQAKLEYERGANEILRDAESKRDSSPDRRPPESASAPGPLGEDLANLASYKWALQHAESKLAETKSENEALKLRLKDSSEGSEKLASALRKESDDVLNKRIIEIEKQLTDKFKNDLKAQDQHAHRRQETATTVLKEHISILENENKKMREALLRRAGGNSPVRKLPPSLESGDKSLNHEAMQAIAYDDELESEKSKNKALRSRLVELEKNARALIISEVNEVENRNSALTARNALLEEELKQYRAYMKDTVGKYKHQVS